MQRRMNVPAHSRPAASLAAETRPFTFVGGGACAAAMTMPATTASALPTMSARAFMSSLHQSQTILNRRNRP